MVPVNGKPVIGWILDDLLAKGIGQATVVLRAEDHRLQDFLQRAYRGRCEMKMALLDQPGTIVDSLAAGLAESLVQGIVRIILGDTLIQDTFQADEDFVYVQEVVDSRRWCLAVLGPENEVTRYVEKQDQVAGLHIALAGYYHLLDGPYLTECVAQSVAAGERELSAVLTRYGQRHPVYGRVAERWFDFGHIDNLIDARRRLLRPRYFNALTVNPVLNTITKVSENRAILQDELDWYLALPADLQVLSPRVVSHQVEDGQLQIVQEYYGYPTLAELYLYSDLHADIWTSVLGHLIRIHQEFRRYEGALPSTALRAIYLDKTWERLDLLSQQDAEWQALLARPALTFNGQTLYNAYTLAPAIQERAERLVETAPISIIHGDYCFSNILFDVNNRIVRLIDPRGRFGEKGIYGDARYDIAKLRHSISGLYDYIVADMFELAQEGDAFTGEIYVNGTPRAVGNVFDDMVEQLGYTLADIQFIEGLLFISMLPLHQGHPQRQRMMYLRGLSLLNAII